MAPAVSIASLALEMASQHAQERRELIDVTRFSANGSALQEMVSKIRQRAVALSGMRHSAMYVVDHGTTRARSADLRSLCCAPHCSAAWCSALLY